MLWRMRVLASRIDGWFSKRTVDEEISQELSEHLEMLTEENVRRGMTGEEARRMRLASEAENWERISGVIGRVLRIAERG